MNKVYRITTTVENDVPFAEYHVLGTCLEHAANTLKALISHSQERIHECDFVCQIANPPEPDV